MRLRAVGDVGEAFGVELDALGVALGLGADVAHFDAGALQAVGQGGGVGKHVAQCVEVLLAGSEGFEGVDFAFL